MNFEGGMILLLGVIFGVPLLLGLLHLLNWIAGRTLIPLWLPIVLLIVLPVAGSFYLDTAGEVHAVKVITKNETIKYGRQFHDGGSWTRQLSVQVEHPWADHSLTPYLSLSADADTFDALRVGQMAQVRVLELGRLFKFGRFANRSTLSMIAFFFRESRAGLGARRRRPWSRSATLPNTCSARRTATRRCLGRTSSSASASRRLAGQSLLKLWTVSKSAASPA